ncbi:hypothetical protein BX257_4043 [Streptomyces sp. 3212.3]|uniref:hypothetical protein n=1 Tax=Streptomyces sp. 3212.3 TaxID=1938846 RepID=UPI000E23B66D|nr:hypothetical protein [Streptomyces sp. 3212.3]REE61464.1 hypothetical protein BX257_4043 [Streptomyces sp. 3212.3]
MSEQGVSTASTEGGSWVLKLRHENDDTKHIAEVWSFGVKLSVTTLTEEGVVTVEDPSRRKPAVHRFDDTREAYDASQCRDDIHDGDVLVVASEGVVGLLDQAWPVAFTEAHGEFHGPLGVAPREYKDGRYAASIDLIEGIAAAFGFAMRTAPTHSA